MDFPNKTSNYFSLFRKHENHFYVLVIPYVNEI